MNPARKGNRFSVHLDGAGGNLKTDSSIRVSVVSWMMKPVLERCPANDQLRSARDFENRVRFSARLYISSYEIDDQPRSYGQDEAGEHARLVCLNPVGWDCNLVCLRSLDDALDLVGAVQVAPDDLHTNERIVGELETTELPGAVLSHGDALAGSEVYRLCHVDSILAGFTVSPAGGCATGARHRGRWCWLRRRGGGAGSRAHRCSGLRRSAGSYCSICRRGCDGRA